MNSTNHFGGEDSSTDSCASFRAYMEQQLPKQVCLYLQACGFDSEKAFTLFDSTGGESDSLHLVTETMQKHHEVFTKTIPESDKMYGIFSAKPDSFCILPGHRVQIADFVKDVKKWSQRRASELASKPKPWQGTSDASPENGASRMSVEDIPDILLRLRHTIFTNFNTNVDFAELQILDGQHYSVQVAPSAVRGDTSGEPVCATVTCHICGTRVNLPIVHSRFRPGNFYRHMKSCIFNRNRKGQNRKCLPAHLQQGMGESAAEFVISDAVLAENGDSTASSGEQVKHPKRELEENSADD